jgi:uncharacterized membrane protein
MSQKKQGQWAKEFDDLAEAFSGAFLFGTPLLFTMEMWWIGTYSELWRLLIFLGLALMVNTVLSYMAGFKQENTFFAAIMQAIEAVAVGADCLYNRAAGVEPYNPGRAARQHPG